VHTGKTILVVEDDAELRRMLRTVLTLAGFDVREACDGHDALRSIDQHIPDLVVLDLGLPLFDGLAVREEMAAHALTRTLPVVIVTGEQRDLSDVHVACVLRKPVNPEEVVAAVRRCLHRASVAMASWLPIGPAGSPRTPAWRASGARTPST
jgi:DNA-binding response OmpR family regulator